MLWYLTVDEQIFNRDNYIHLAIHENKELLDIFTKVITTPIVASACTLMFNVFIDIVL